jgi:hypothetical protein
VFYTRGLGIVVLRVMVPQPYRLPLCFLIVNEQNFLFQMGEGYASILGGGGGGGG